MRSGRCTGREARQYRQGLRRAQAGLCPGRSHGQDIAGARQEQYRAVQIPARHRVCRYLAPHGNRQTAALCSETKVDFYQPGRCANPSWPILRPGLKPGRSLLEVKMKTLQPPSWDKPRGYANGMMAELEVGSRIIFVGGQIGWNAQMQFETDDLVEQVGQTLRNIVEVLREGGAGPEHIARMTWYVRDKQEYLASLKGIGEQ